MHFFIHDYELLETYNGIWNGVLKVLVLKKYYSIKKELDCEPIYNKKFLKNKKRCYCDEATCFHDKEVP